MMTPRLMPLAATALILTLSTPAMAQDFDLPPVLPGDSGAGSVPMQQNSSGAAQNNFDLPPTVGDLPPSLEPLPASGNATAQGASAQDQPRFNFLRHGTLELETRLFRNTPLTGTSAAALRLQAHYYGSRALGPNASLLFNLRARTDRVEGQSYSFADDFSLDVQELALTYSLGAQTSLQIGRINIRNGVASGFNPTDWFRDNSLVLTGSAAAADRRNERLGVLALTATTTLGQTLVQAGYRPEIKASSGSIWSDRDNYGLSLDRTNASEAFFIKATPNIGDNLSLTANALMLDGDPGVGFELSGTIGDNLVLYSEVMAQRRLSLAAEALAGGEGSTALRAGLGADESRKWHVQSALGLNWALPQNLVGMRDISLTFEHHLNTGGLSGNEIDTLATASGADLAATGLLYGLANRRQAPLARQQLFTRIAWNDIWGDSDLAMLAYYVPEDSSGLGQISLDVPIGQNATLNLRAVQSFGDTQSIYGANPTKRSVQAAMIWRF